MDVADIDFSNPTVSAVVGGMLTLAGSLITYFFAIRTDKKKTKELAIKELLSAVNLYHTWGIKQAEFDTIVRFHTARQGILESTARYEQNDSVRQELRSLANAEGEHANRAVGSSREYARLCDEMSAKAQGQLYELRHKNKLHIESIVEKNLNVSISFDMDKKGSDFDEVNAIYAHARKDINSRKNAFKKLRRQLEEKL